MPLEEHQIRWRTLIIRVTHRRNHHGPGWSRLDVSVVKPRGHPLPMTGRDHSGHELDEDQLAAAGGPIPYVTVLLDRDAPLPRYRIAVARWQQLDLFGR